MLFFNDYKDKLEKIKEQPYFEDYINSIKAFFEEEHSKPVPPLDYSDFMLFQRTGSRKEFQGKYFLRRRRLIASMILFLLYKEEKYLDEACNLIWHICSENTWVLPAHIRTKWYDIRADIDLFVAETATLLAEAHYFLRDALPENLKDLIFGEVSKRAFDTFETREEFSWERERGNWSAVCAGHIGMTYMYLDPERFKKTEARFMKSFNNYLLGFGEDGITTEGFNYWTYGFGSYVCFADMYYTFTGKKIDFFSDEKVKSIAFSFQKMVLRKDINVTFSDSIRNHISPQRFDMVGVLCYLKNRYPDLWLPDIKPAVFLTRHSEIALRNLLWTNPQIFEEADLMLEDSVYCADVKWFVSHKKKYSFVAKAGHNNEGHNHNDVGNFIFADDTEQLICDIGGIEYTAKTWGYTRYDNFGNGSQGHSVPIIDGKYQLAGKQYSATVLSASEDEFSMELQNAYGENLPKIIRTFKLDENGINICDNYEDIVNHTATERFISVIKPEITDGGVKIGNALLISELKPQISTEEVVLMTLKKEIVYIIDYEVKSNNFVLRIEI